MACSVFDGKAFAQKLLNNLQIKRAPTLVTFLPEDDEASATYVNMKRKAVEGVGGRAIVEKEQGFYQIIEKIRKYNADPLVHGIMLQLPLRGNLSGKKAEILSVIDPKKDVDGHLKISPYLPATVKAVMGILDFAGALGDRTKRFVVLGSKGEVGGRVFSELSREGFLVHGYDREGMTEISLDEVMPDVDIFISATGVPGLVKGKYLKKGVVIVDVGFPKGDVIFDEACEVASFITPVPGGVGPVTIASLLENLVIAANS